MIRAFKLLRYSRAVRRYREAFLDVREELTLYFVATLFVVFLASVGIYYFERDAQPERFASIFHCFWWSVTTLSTVGYGDAYPVTTGGKIFTAIVLVMGLGVVAVPTGLLASALTKANHLRKDEKTCRAETKGDDEV